MGECSLYYCKQNSTSLTTEEDEWSQKHMSKCHHGINRGVSVSFLALQKVTIGYRLIEKSVSQLDLGDDVNI